MEINLQEVLNYINEVSKISKISKHDDCKCEYGYSDKEDQEKEYATEEKEFERCGEDCLGENCECNEKEFEGCGKDCLGADCECSKETVDGDEEDKEEVCKTETEADSKSCSSCGEEQHIRNFISLMNGTETNNCLCCRDKRSSKFTVSQAFYAQLKAEMGPCIMCGDCDPDHLEFNHIDRESKTSTVSKMGTPKKQASERKLCNTMCTKCHCVHTHVVQRGDFVRKETRRRKIAREFITNYKLTLCGCQNPNCKDKFDPNNLPFYQFDHKDFRNKLWTISRMVNCGYSIESIKRELEKCILLCTYCHRLKTEADYAKRREYYSSLDRPLVKRKKQETKITFDDAKEIRRLYNEEDMIMADIAKKFNLAPSHTSAIINNKSHVDKSYEKTKLRDEKYKTRITDEQASEIRKKFNDENVSYSELAKQYGITDTTISDIIVNRKHYDPNYVRTNVSNVPVKLNLETAKQIRREYNEGTLNFVKMGGKYGVSQQCISAIIKNKTYKDSTYTRTRMK